MIKIPFEDGSTPVDTAPSPTGSQQNEPDTVAKHIHSGCECRIVEAPTSAIERIRKDGGIPILNLETNDTDKLGISAKYWDGRTKYVVLRHAVRDGFGSPSYRTITTCQLIRIADRMGKLQVEEVQAELCFWLDTLCAPGEEDVSRIYENAYAMLCFDTGAMPMAQGTSAKDPKFWSYVASLFHSHSNFGLNRRLLLVTNQGTIDMSSKVAEAPRTAIDYMPNLSKGDLDWRPLRERMESPSRRTAALRDPYSVVRRRMTESS